MPTALPAAPPRDLSLGETVRLVCLLARSRWLAHRLMRAALRCDRDGPGGEAGAELLRAACASLACYERIAVLLEAPERPGVEALRTALGIEARTRRAARDVLIPPTIHNGS